jgi:predicted RNA-binding Zn ribbon-like protein
VDLRSGEQPGGREPAPGPLRLVQRFVNTVNLEHPEDVIETPQELRAFLLEHTSAPGGLTVGDADVRRAVELREALRRLLLANNGEPYDPAAAAAVEHAGRAAQLGPSLVADGTVALRPGAPGVDGVLGEIVAVAFVAMADGSWSRLKACRRDVCHWAFYDGSRNMSGAWCSMSICGNRTKTRSYRRRRAG